ncbi:4Fe-4S binding protein [Staphylothermus hellenicus]|uniref:4Fe-4S binding protein n=1 Tax=Staphylothermus hellenicus TaxID=84599 RepID=UPI00164F927A|nr:4Fe-4S binding protein [Staphylothermus hellenicus]
MVNIIIDHEKCDLCGLCVEYCPTHVFYVRANRVFADNNKCVECYACIPLCPRNAISIENPDP